MTARKEIIKQQRERSIRDPQICAGEPVFKIRGGKVSGTCEKLALTILVHYICKNIQLDKRPNANFFTRSRYLCSSVFSGNALECGHG